jgi:hypothetical protein
MFARSLLAALVAPSFSPCSREPSKETAAAVRAILLYAVDGAEWSVMWR